MKRAVALWSIGIASLGLCGGTVFGQTDGGATFEVRINDYNGSGTRHWTVAWVTTASGTFIKTLRKQGPTITATHWGSHCGVWYSAKGSSTALDGYSGATAADYAGTNSPVIWTWNCRDANNSLVADGGYTFWVQYAEDSGQGPYTTNGLPWVKGPTAVTNTFANFGANFTNVRVVWSPAAPPPPPNIATARLEGNNLVLSGTGPANRTYYMLTATTADAAAPNWKPIRTNVFDSSGRFSFTNTINLAEPRLFYRQSIP